MQVRQKKPKQNMKFRISFVILFVFASFICFMTLFLKESQPISYDKSGAEIIDKSPALVSQGVTRTNRYFRKCIFIDSKTASNMEKYGLILSENVFSKENALNAGGDRQAVYFFPDKVPGENEKILSDKLKEKYGAYIYYVSLLPSDNADENIENDAINADILRFCENNGYYYIDINSYLKNDDGKLDDIYSESYIYGKINDYLLSHTAN